jgi:hypothetical protein
MMVIDESVRRELSDLIETSSAMRYFLSVLLDGGTLSEGEKNEAGRAMGLNLGSSQRLNRRIEATS